jgi:hypothetical protein
MENRWPILFFLILFLVIIGFPNIINNLVSPNIPGQLITGSAALPDWAIEPQAGFVFNLDKIGLNLTVGVEADFIYSDFYVYNETGSKTKYKFENQPMLGSKYIEEKANKTIPLSEGNHWVAVYACNKQDGGFECNGNKWMLKSIEISVPKSVGLCGNRICDEGEAESCPQDCECTDKGCYLELATGDIKIAETREDCQSYALAYKYADVKDALRLTLKESIEYNIVLESEIEFPKATYVIKYNNCTSIEYFDYSGTKQNCELIDFFGVNLYCFNGIYTDKQGQLKENNMQSIIAPLTFLKMSGKDDMWNPLTEQTIEPFDFLIQEKIKYVDGTSLFALNREVYSPEERIPDSLTSLKIKDIRCSEEGYGGAANFQFRNADFTKHLEIHTPSQMDSGLPYPSDVLQNYVSTHDEPKYTVFFCRTDGKERKVHYAGILYHEASHKLFGSHVASCEGVPAGDFGWKTVYGAHVAYLFQASQNEFLTCPERNELFDRGEAEFRSKLCGVTHSYVTPVCKAALCGNKICDKGEEETCPEDCGVVIQKELCEQTKGTWRNCSSLKCPYSYFVGNDCICPPQSEWQTLKTDIKNKVREGCSCPAGTKWDSEKGCRELINAKNMSKYSTKETFLISDNDWHDVLSLVPLTVWTGNESCNKGYGTPENVCTYPTLIYHEEETGFDADSIIYFMQQYLPDKVTIIGSTQNELDNLLITSPDLGAGLNSNQIQRISANDYFSYWQSYKDVVYVENDYELALLASTYASLINAPLVIKGTSSDTAGVFSGKNVICVGSASPSGSSCNERYTLEQLQQKYVDETNTDKIILVNANDLEIYHTDTEMDKRGAEIPAGFSPEKSTGEIFRLYTKTSLSAPILASAKHELIASVSLDEVHDLGVDEPFENNLNIEIIKNEIDYLINITGLHDIYLTILASPNAVPEANVGKLSNNEIDYYYGLSPPYLRDSFPYAIVDNKGIHIIWLGKRDNKYAHINNILEFGALFYKKISFDGSVIVDDKQITNQDLTFPFFSLDTQEDNNIYLVFAVTKEYGDCSQLSVEECVSYSYCAWSDKGDSCYNQKTHYFESYFVKFDKEGNKLSEDILLGKDIFMPKIDSDSDGNILMAYLKEKEHGGSEIHIKRLSKDGVLSDLSTDLAHDSQDLLFGIDSLDNAHILFRNFTNVYYAKLDAQGNLVVSPIPILTLYDTFFVPSLIFKENLVYVLYVAESPDGRNLHYLVIDDTGTIFQQASQITFGQLISDMSAYANPAGEIILVYDDYLKSGQGISPAYVHNFRAQAGVHELLYAKLDEESKKLDNTERLTNNSFVTGVINSLSPKIIEGLNNQELIISEFQYPSHSNLVLFSKSNQTWSDSEKLTDFRYAAKTGRIYGISNSDVSSYIARSIYYDKLKEKLPDVTGLAIGHSPDVCSMWFEELIRNETEDYGTECFTEIGGACSMFPPAIPNAFKNRQFITYCDHGWPGGWAFTLASNQIPWQTLTYAAGYACSTASFEQSHELQYLFSANLIRKGAIGYHGAIDVSSTAVHGFHYDAIKKLISDKDVTLGELHQHLFFHNHDEFKARFILIGDPTLKPNFSEVEWT